MSGRVLVVDDVEANVKLLEAKLSSEYFDVLSADNGRTALQIAEVELPDVILLDVMMPRMDGFEVCRLLKANPRTADVPVVMVTALSDVANRLRGLEAGADDFLTKPVNDIALFARVRSLVRLKRMMEELRVREGICGRFGGRDAPAAEDAGPARILIVEDDEFAAARMVETLQPIAHSVTRASNCAEAQMLLAGDTELIIASLSTPGDPLRLVTWCRASEVFRQLPILLIAEETDLPRLAKGLDLLANDYLIRPVDRNELLARTATQVRRKGLKDRLQESYRRSLELALTDSLTGLYNRRYLDAHLDELIARRYNGGRTTLFATNYSLSARKESVRTGAGGYRNTDEAQVGRESELLRDRVGERIYSRLCEMCEFAELPLGTPDRRYTKHELESGASRGARSK